MPKELWTDVCNILQEAVTKTISSEEGLQTAEKRKEAKNKGEKERYTHLNAEFQRIAGEMRKLSSVINAKK